MPKTMIDYGHEKSFCLAGSRACCDHCGKELKDASSRNRLMPIGIFCNWAKTRSSVIGKLDDRASPFERLSNRDERLTNQEVLTLNRLSEFLVQLTVPRRESRFEEPDIVVS